MALHGGRGPPGIGVGVGGRSAVQDDTLYRQRDAAKKRAVVQGGSYEDFQNMVSVAHLRPIQDKTSIRKGAAPPRAHARARGRRPAPHIDARAAIARR